MNKRTEDLRKMLRLLGKDIKRLEQSLSDKRRAASELADELAEILSPVKIDDVLAEKEDWDPRKRVFTVSSIDGIFHIGKNKYTLRIDIYVRKHKKNGALAKRKEKLNVWSIDRIWQYYDKVEK
jgi:hypothetical protein